jgi:hemolysin activation/secretion protein
LLVQTEDTPLISGNIDVDNFGSYYTGESRVGSTVYINSPTRHGDQITLRLVTSGSSSNYVFGSYSFPISGSGLRLGFSVDYLDYELEKEFAGLGAEGDASEMRVFSSYPFIRSRHVNLIGRVDFSKLKLEDNNDNGLLAKRTVDSAVFSLSGDHDDDLLANGTTYFSATFTTGSIDIKGNDAFESFDQQNTDTEGSFQKLKLDLSRLQHIIGDVSTYLSLSGQLASDNLDSSQKFFIGGPFSMPGYPTGEASGDEGVLFHADLRYEFYHLPWHGNLQVSAFYSWGEVELYKNTWPGWEAGNPIIENRISLESFGFGVNQSWPEGLVLRGMVGWQVGGNEGRNPTTDKDSDNSSSNSRAWLQAIYYF